MSLEGKDKIWSESNKFEPFFAFHSRKKMTNALKKIIIFKYDSLIIIFLQVCCTDLKLKNWIKHIQ